MSPNKQRNKATGGEAIDGLIIAAFGRHYEVATAAGRLRCYTRGKKSSFACGDHVRVTPGGDDQGVIDALKLALKVAFNSALGFGAVWLLNLTTSVTGLSLGLNWFNALLIGILGLPGFGLLLLVQWVLT